MTQTTVHPRAKALFEELLAAADEFITVPTAQKMAAELGIDLDVQDFDRSY